ncbi:hypothetical protein HYDPIDRAFT_177697 [Hydnomerulius pinastri MD-312]|uniref:CxC2-like cysteine cluster KDZ transposase-associated domain-containing protein n=1 Tax=Hydnomerulius pinastri MD-312 TaxID=994086 RepID=A0A0C9V377_9AGAM|nr:hypothetical protein HYDPIDRAFT_177697 [Hydnomerulius pinastri MD-312]
MQMHVVQHTACPKCPNVHVISFPEGIVSTSTPSSSGTISYNVWPKTPPTPMARSLEATKLPKQAGVWWIDNYFVKLSLKDAGQIIRLGHGSQPCLSPISAHLSFTVIDNTGLHNVSVQFYGCLDSPSHYIQLLHMRYSEFSRVVRQWQHVITLKHAGQGHNPAGVAAMQPGALVIEYLYALYLSMDANFKLSLKDHKLKDIKLAPGLGCMVKEDMFQQTLRSHLEQPEESMCHVQHDVIVQVNTQSATGYLATGVGAVMCVHHFLVRKNGIVDLQKGEKYVNMDYALFLTLVGVSIGLLFITYDIACQYHKKLFAWMRSLPDILHFEKPRSSMPFPTTLSLNFLQGSARTCGEGIETIWAHINGIGMSIREMSPGAQHETLNNHTNTWNWWKIVGMGSHLLKKLKEAHAMVKKHQAFFDMIMATFNSGTISAWTHAIQAWEADLAKPSPYLEPESCTTQADICLQLAWEDVAEAQDGTVSPHFITASQFLQMGLDIEEQCTLHSNLKDNGTSTQLTRDQEKQNVLQHCISWWRELQHIYMPFLVSQLDNSELDEDSTSKSTPLFLPSSVPQFSTNSPGFSDLCQKELHPRKAQADDSLKDVRCHCHIIQGLWDFKRANVSGTGNHANTRARAILEHFVDKMNNHAACYCCARLAIIALDPSTDWRSCLHELKQGDLRGPARDAASPSEGRYKQSWIWLIPPIGHSESVLPTQAPMMNSELNKHVRVEWAKSHVWLERWKEERLLVTEEMRRVLAYFEWKATWWKDKAEVHIVGDVQLAHGLRVYAHKQASTFQSLTQKFAHMWVSTLKSFGLPAEWESSYFTDANPSPERNTQLEVMDGEDSEDSTLEVGLVFDEDL